MQKEDKITKNILLKWSILWVILSSIILTASLKFFYQTTLGQAINDRVATTMEFRLRNYLDKNVDFDPRIKIFGYDDKTLSILKRPELYLEEWADSLKRIAENKPKLIIIDKIFSILYDPNKKIEYAFDTIKKLKVPIVVGSFVTPQNIKFREKLDIRKKLFNLPYMRDKGWDLTRNSRDLFNEQMDESKDKIYNKKSGDPFNFLRDYRNQFVYGPNPLIQDAFSFVGHLQYSGHSKTAPLIRVYDNFILPHASLYAANKVKIKDKKIVVDGINIDLDSSGDTIINLSPAKAYYKNLKRMNLLLGKKKYGNLVDEGDVVLILLNMYTGGTDFHLTPFGYMPGGFILAAMINSSLTGKWMKSTSFDWLLIGICCILGGLLGVFAGTFLFWTLLIIGTLSFISLGIFSFSYMSFIIPWLWITSGFVGDALLVFAAKTRFHEKRAQQLQLVEAERKLLARELKEASVMAEAYKPDSWPQWNEYLVGGYHQPLHAASGDWFAFEQSTSKHLSHLIMCDITGHGLQAALVVSACKTLLGNIKSMRPEMLEQKDFIVEYMKVLNKVLWHQGQGQHVTTLLGLTFEPEKNCLYYLAAGHPYPLLSRNGDWKAKPTPLISRHNPLGIIQDCEPTINITEFNTGDEVIAFTDGVPLLENRRILKKMQARDNENIFIGPKEILDLSWKSETNKTGKSPDDDVSIVWFKRL